MNEHLQKLQLQRYDMFKSQNPEVGRFELTFEIDGKLLHAHRAVITLVSNTFDTMLSERWNGNCDDAIKIEGNSFDDFCNFVHFLYSGSCELNATNIYAMIDIAECYNVGAFKSYCEDFASKMKFTRSDFFELLKIAIKYSMDILKAVLFKGILPNFAKFSDAEEFLTFDVTAMKEIAAAAKGEVKPETLFQALFKWSEHQATNQQNSSINDTFNLNEAIKHEISPFLPLILFEWMELKFVTDFVVKRGFVFSYEKLSKILQKCCEPFKIKVTNSKGKSIVGQIPHYDNFVQILKTLRSDSAVNYVPCNWYFKIIVRAPPLVPSYSKKIKKDCWYLFYFPNGQIGFTRSTVDTKSNLVICEMIAEDDFSVTQDCKIKIYR